MTQAYKKFQRIFATLTLAAVTMLFLVISNVHQPIDLFGFHCTVHDYVTKALGGECESHSLGLFSAMDGMALAIFFFAAIIVSVSVPLLELVVTRVSIQNRVPRGPRDKLQQFYSRGIAASRRFA